jgi:RNA polymerase sigma-70 factor, ECF subfamily
LSSASQRLDERREIGELVTAAQGGDDNAFVKLMCRYQGPIHQLAAKLTDDAEMAEDLTLETFTRAYQDLGRFSGKAAFFTWLYRIALNLGLRHRQRVARRLEDPVPHVELERLPGAVEGDATLQNVVDRSRREALLLCLAKVSEQQRVALFLFYLEAYTYVEIGEALGLPVNTVKSHVRRGTTRLRQLLGAADLLEINRGGSTETTSDRR